MVGQALHPSTQLALSRQGDQTLARLRDIVIVIGAMKAGTSSLHSYLNLHPDLAMSRTKELNFFVEHQQWGRGAAWYRNQFRASGRVCGESSPNYTKFPTFPGVPARMRQLIPEARFVYLVRDPVSRIMSHYVHNLSHGRETRPIELALAHPEDNPYVYPSRYAFQLEQYFKHFGQEQFLIIDNKTLLAQRRQTLRQVFEFVGVDAAFDDPGFDKLFHASAHKGRPTPLAHRLQRWPLGRLIRYALPWFFEQPLLVPLLPDVRQALEAVLKPDADRLRAITGQNFADWCV